MQKVLFNSGYCKIVHEFHVYHRKPNDFTKRTDVVVEEERGKAESLRRVRGRD
jgi:hypothetical protein